MAKVETACLQNKITGICAPRPCRALPKSGSSVRTRASRCVRGRRAVAFARLGVVHPLCNGVDVHRKEPEGVSGAVSGCVHPGEVREASIVRKDRQRISAVQRKFLERVRRRRRGRVPSLFVPGTTVERRRRRSL